MARPLRPLLLLLLAPLAGCPGSNNPAVGTAPTTAAATVCPPTTASAAPTATPGPAGFREDFDGPILDQDRWGSFAQSGIIRFEDGKLDLLNVGTQKSFPYLVTKPAIIPATGAFFFETSYTLVTGGAQISFCLDYLPADQPNEPAVSKPFMYTNWFYSYLQLSFDTEAGIKGFQGPKGAAPGSPHRLRVENDGGTTYRVIFDTTELGTFTSKRRPMRFWLGTNPVVDQKAGQTWPRVQVDYVAAGPLTAPDPATPAAPSAAPAAASPSPSPTP